MRKFSDVHLRDLTPMLSPLLGQQTQFADRPATIAIVVLAAGRAASAAGDVRHVRAFWHTLPYQLADCFRGNRLLSTIPDVRLTVIDATLWSGLTAVLTELQPTASFRRSAYRFISTW
jgi:hypothetical protein